MSIEAQTRSRVRELREIFWTKVNRGEAVPLSQLPADDPPVVETAMPAPVWPCIPDQPARTILHVSDIIKAVAFFADVSTNEIKSMRRQARIVRPRQVAMYLARQMTTYSYPHIGRAFGGKDHTTILHACSKIDAKIAAGDQSVIDLVRNTRNHLERLIAPSPSMDAESE